MHTIIELNGSEIETLRRVLTNADTLRVCVESGQVMFKANQRMWTEPLGSLDPMCGEALHHKQIRDQSNGPIVQDDKRALQFVCPTCASAPGRNCTEATEDKRKSVAYIHTKRIDVLRDVLESQ